ncbi:hypothetical protein DUNSADRAFT_11517 [Dunaliella salina]|uniref:Polycystin cation channel PKD1/PKD2 domain-containing protein n=1 Tax=Dunaliella salina TaxID=3046 RepID=A0ABQ7H4L3_DUNSA|nr:hypothetical protein DUNSADRAFT_11517 [Dunaliella salina]|eukprot:KAF5841738.1 hypothetical protein DUNSADRAFT_11517 [Dunaliella salina]
MLAQSDVAEEEGMQSEGQAGSRCFQQTCSPSAADGGQCPPGRFAYRYQAADVADRTSSSTILLRVEQGSRHALNLTVALGCDGGPEQLQQQVDQLGVDTALPYMKDLGLQLHTVRQVTLLSPIRVNHTIMHPGDGDNLITPTRCLASLDLDVQVGCTPEDQGFSGGPSGNETDGQWCPCNVKWNPDYLGAPLDVDQPFSIEFGLFGPMVSYQLSHPAGSNPFGPSPLCAPITPSSESELAQIRHGAGKLSLLMDLTSINIIPMLQKVQRVTMQTEEEFHEIDTRIEAKWRALMDMFVEQYLEPLISDLQDIADTLDEFTLNRLDEASADTLTRLSTELDNSGFDETMYLTSTLSLERLGMAPVSESEVGSVVETCVYQDRGGPDARFHFWTLPQDLGSASSASGGSAAVQSQYQAFYANGRLLQDLSWSGYPMAGNQAAASAATEDGADVWEGKRGTTGVQRLVGVRTQQQVLTGAALYQQRRPPVSLLPGGDRYSKLCRQGGLALHLSAECGTARAEAILSTLTEAAAARETATEAKDGLGSQNVSMKAGQLSGDSALTIFPGIGADPAFADTSKLYNPQVASRPDAWYNTSLEANELNKEGVPFGFFPHNIFPGLPPVYPVVVDINLREAHIIRNFQYMLEGAYLDQYATRLLAMKLATYNVELQLYGFVRVFASWDDGGIIRAHFEVEALEYRDYSAAGLQADGMVNRLVTDIMLLLLVLLYCALTVEDGVKSIQAQRQKRERLAALQRQRDSGMHSLKHSFTSPISSPSSRSSEGDKPWDPTSDAPAALQNADDPSPPAILASTATPPQPHLVPPCPVVQHAGFNPRLPHHFPNVFQGVSKLGPDMATSLSPPTASSAAPKAASLREPSPALNTTPWVDPCHQKWSWCSSIVSRPQESSPSDHGSPIWPELWPPLPPPTPRSTSTNPSSSDHPGHAAQGWAWFAGRPPHHNYYHQHHDQLKEQHTQPGIWSPTSQSTTLSSAPFPLLPPSSRCSSDGHSVGNNKPSWLLDWQSSNTPSAAPLKPGHEPLSGAEGPQQQAHDGGRAPAQALAEGQQELSRPEGHKHEMPWSDNEDDYLGGLDDEASMDGQESKGERSEHSRNSSEFEACVDDYPVAVAADMAGKWGNARQFHRKRVVGGRRIAVQQDKYRGIWNLGWILNEAILCAAMLAAVGLWFYYSLGLVPSHAPSERRTIVYDSLDAPARPLMLRHTADASSGSGSGGGVEPLAGTAGRWQYGAEDVSGLRELASMHEHMEDMSSFKIIYSLVQGGALVLLLAGFIQQISFQPKLSVISGTLLRALPDIMYFIFIVTLLGVMLSMVLVTVFGAQGFPETSTISGGLLVVFRDIATGAIDDDVMEFFRTQAHGAYDEPNAAVSALAWFFILIRPLIFLFLLVMVMALLLTPYARLRQGATDAPGVHHDLAVLLQWAWRVTHGKLSGHAVLVLLHEVLRNRRVPSSSGASMLWRTGSKLLNNPALGSIARHASMKLPSFKPSNGAKGQLPGSLPKVAQPGSDLQAPLPPTSTQEPSRPTFHLQADDSVAHRPTLRSMKYGKGSSEGQALGLSALMLTAKSSKYSSKYSSLPESLKSTGLHQSGPEQSPQPASSSKAAHHALPPTSSSWARRMRLTTQQVAWSFRKSSSVAPSDAGSVTLSHRKLSQNLSGLRSASVCEPISGHGEAWMHAAAGEHHSMMYPEEQGSLRTPRGSLQMAHSHASGPEAAEQEGRTTESQRRVPWGGSDDVEDDELVGRTWGRVQAVVQTRMRQEREQARAAERVRRGALTRSLLGGPGTTKSVKPRGFKKSSSGIEGAEGACLGRLVTLQESQELCSTAADAAAACVDAATRLSGEGKGTGQQQQQQQQQQHERNPRCVAAPARLPLSYSFRKREGGQQATERTARSSSCSTEDKQQCPSVPDSPRTHLPLPAVPTNTYQQGGIADPGTPPDTPLQQACSGSRSSSSSSSSCRLSTMQEVIACTEESVAMVEQLQAASQGLRALVTCVAGLMRTHAERKQQLLQREHKSGQRSPARLTDSAPSSGDSNSISLPQIESTELKSTHAEQLDEQVPQLCGIEVEHGSVAAPAQAQPRAASAGLPEADQAKLQGTCSTQSSMQGPQPCGVATALSSGLTSPTADSAEAGLAKLPDVLDAQSSSQLPFLHSIEEEHLSSSRLSPTAAADPMEADLPGAEGARSTQSSLQVPQLHSISVERPAALSSTRTSSTAASDPAESDQAKMQGVHSAQANRQISQLSSVAVEHPTAPHSGHASPTAEVGASDPAEADQDELQSMRGSRLSPQMPQLRSVTVKHPTASSPSGHASPTGTARTSNPAWADLAELQGMRDAQRSLQVPRLHSVTVEHPAAEPRH